MPNFGMVLFAGILALLCYCVAARSELTRGLQPDATDNFARIWTTAALIAHTGLHFHAAARGHGLDLHFVAALSAAGLAMALVTQLVSLSQPIGRLGVLVYPIAGLCALGYALVGPRTVTPEAQSWQITLHALFALFAFGTLAIAALVAVLLEVQERALRARRLSDVLGAFPPLALVETLLFQLIGAGFALLTLTLVSGVLFVENLFAQHLVHKTVLSIAAWLVFGILLLARLRYGWRGRRAVRWTLAGMLLLLLGFVGSKFVLEVVLQRAG